MGRGRHWTAEDVLFGCGSAGLCARGLCRACYNGYYRSQLYFSGFREEVLARDGWRCRVCSLPTNVVHHRRPGKNHPRYLISLCPAHHAVVTRLLLLDHTLPPLLFLLWREQHPVAPEQLLLPWPEKRIKVEGASLSPGGAEARELELLVQDQRRRELSRTMSSDPQSVGESPDRKGQHGGV